MAPDTRTTPYLPMFRPRDRPGSGRFSLCVWGQNRHRRSCGFRMVPMAARIRRTAHPLPAEREPCPHRARSRCCDMGGGFPAPGSVEQDLCISGGLRTNQTAAVIDAPLVQSAAPPRQSYRRATRPGRSGGPRRSTRRSRRAFQCRHAGAVGQERREACARATKMTSNMTSNGVYQPGRGPNEESFIDRVRMTLTN